MKKSTRIEEEVNCDIWNEPEIFKPYEQNLSTQMSSNLFLSKSPQNDFASQAKCQPFGQLLQPQFDYSELDNTKSPLIQNTGLGVNFFPQNLTINNTAMKSQSIHSFDENLFRKQASSFLHENLPQKKNYGVGKCVLPDCQGQRAYIQEERRFIPFCGTDCYEFFVKNNLPRNF